MHIPVLQKEVIEYLDPKPNENFIDATIDGGGHSLAILEKTSPKGKILGIDEDQEQIKKLKCSVLPKISSLKANKLKIKNSKRIILVCDNFINIRQIAEKENFKTVSGIIFDLGMSSWHLEESGRGFSFLRNEPLDMRYNIRHPLTAEKIINYYSFAEIEKILREYGEEKFSQKIAKEIIEARKIKPIKTTLQLMEIIKRAVPQNYEQGRINPATRTFQALRISVNDELNNLKRALPQTLAVLKSGGRLAVISFHSLEDRIVKHFLRENKDFLKILTKKPLTASEEEIKINPRSRSAKLRVAKKL